MAVTFDATGPFTNNLAVSPIAWSHVVGATADLIMSAHALDGATGITPAHNPLAVTFNSVPLPSLLNWQAGGATQTSGYLAVNSLFSPATGSHSMSGTFTNTGMDTI